MHLVEAKYLEAEVHSLMEIGSVRIDLKILSRQILLVSEPKEKLKGTHVLKYIRWGEREGFHERSTCASRNPWYDLAVARRGDMFWPMAQQYRHVIPLNEQKLICNHNLFDVFAPPEVGVKPLAAVLNSTIVGLFKHSFGRYLGREGNLKTEVVDTKMMVVPDPRRAKTSSSWARTGAAGSATRR